MDFSRSFWHFLYGVLLMRIFLVASIISALRFILSHHSGYSALFGALVVVLFYCSKPGTGVIRVAPAFILCTLYLSGSARLACAPCGGVNGQSLVFFIRQLAWLIKKYSDWVERDEA